MAKISMDKKYKTRDGRPVRILCVDLKNQTYPVLALVMKASEETIITCTKDGDYVGNHEHELDLIEISPYEGFKIDDPVMVSDDGNFWLPRHFAGIGKEGRPRAYRNGTTSWSTTESSLSWDHCRRSTTEELLKKGENKEDVPLSSI